MYSGKSGCNRSKVVVFEQKWLFRRNGYIRARVVVFEKRVFIREKVFELVQGGCIWAMVIVLGKIGCIRRKLVVFGQSG